MKIEYLKENRTLILKIDGEIDHHSCEQIKKEADYEIQKNAPKKLTFDFKNVNFMDSSGIGMIMGRYKSIQKNSGKVAITGLQPTVKKIVQMSGLHKILDEYDNLDIAMNKLNVI